MHHVGAFPETKAQPVLSPKFSLTIGYILTICGNLSMLVYGFSHP